MEVFNQSRTPTLEELNSEEVSKHVGGIIFVSVLMVTGLIGNIHVLIVFGLKMKPSNHKTFICFLGVMDLITSCVGMPFILVDLTHPLTFFMTTACKILRCLNYFTGLFSIFIMLVVSTDRYRKVCEPLGWQLSVKTSRIACVIVTLIAAGLSWPALVLFGHTTVQTGYANVTGVRCATADEYINSSYQLVFNIAIIVFVWVAFVVHIVLYSIICRVIRNHSLNNLQIKNIKSIKRVPTPESAISTTDISVVCVSDPSPQFTRKCEKMPNDLTVSSKSVKSPDGSQKSSMHVKNQVKKFRETRRMTIIFFAIIAIFFISYIPHLTLKIVLFTQRGFLKSLSRPELLLYNTFIWCFFINNVANPIVYMFLDIKFRAEVMSFYRHLFLG